MNYARPGTRNNDVERKKIILQINTKMTEYDI